ncbi:cation diffusion facilitator family transporter [Shewanella indica]|uniref:cation diffusion facilitator family transporter n=1 Tax=Shewanella indica TaxID=768528 RepID=UPI001F3361B1|nr:cation diffusion facilitator family transporter [Shewanella indica]
MQKSSQEWLALELENTGHFHQDNPDHGGRLGLAVIINMLLTLAQLFGGIWAGSLSLIADALHNFGDAIAILIALIARKLSRKTSHPGMSYGYKRAEVLGTFINAAILSLVGVYLVYEALQRFWNPQWSQQAVDGLLMFWLAALALIIYIGTAMLTYGVGAKDKMNIRAAFVHNVSDAMASVAVLVASGLIILYQWYWVDLLVTVLISVYVIHHGALLLAESGRILMQQAPADLAPELLQEQLAARPEVVRVESMHLWRLDEKQNVLTAVVYLEPGLDSVSPLAQQRLRCWLSRRTQGAEITLECRFA